MSWLSDIADWAGSAFEGSSVGGNVPPSVASSSSSIWSNPNLWGSIITAGSGLAGNYFNQQNAASMNDAQIAMAQNQIEAQKEIEAQRQANALKMAGTAAGAQVAAAKISAGAQLGVARKNNLQQLYSQWATNTRQAGADEADAAVKTGQLMQSPILARLQALR